MSQLSGVTLSRKLRSGLTATFVLTLLSSGCAEYHTRDTGAVDPGSAATRVDGGNRLLSPPVLTPARSAAGAPAPSRPSDEPPSACQDCTIPPGGENYMAHSCCSENQRCGVSFPELGFPQCFEQNSPGTRDPSCPDFAPTSNVNSPGCCRSDGLCGAFDTLLMSLGCVLLPFMPPTPCDSSVAQPSAM